MPFRIFAQSNILMSIKNMMGMGSHVSNTERIPALHLVRADSHSPETVQKIRDILKDNSLDFLFIDGDHFGVSRDYELYEPLERSGGIIALHDIVSGSPASVGVVPQFWQQIKSQVNHKEFVDNWKQGGLWNWSYLHDNKECSLPQED